MFEDKPNQGQSGQLKANSPAPPQPSSSPRPPADLPVSNKEPEDILADVETDNISVQKPVQSASLPQSNNLGALVPPAQHPQSQIEANEPFIKKYQKIIVVILLVLVGGGVLAAGGWYAYNNFIVSEPSDGLVNTNLNTNQGVANVNQNTNQAAVNLNQNTNQPSAINQNINRPAPPVDTDRDGITDEEEALYGTNPNKVDTDDDELTDRDEIKVFKTDPNNPDTDGDGFSDGEEVRGGYDPKGSGRLLKIE